MVLGVRYVVGRSLSWMLWSGLEVSALCKFSAFPSSLHLPAVAGDLCHRGVSFVELLVLFEQWSGHRLLSEKVVGPEELKLGSGVRLLAPWHGHSVNS